MEICEKLVVLGAGGFGREIAFVLSEVNKKSGLYHMLGFVDNDISLQGKMIDGYPVLGDDSWLLNYSSKINVVIGIGNPKIRKQAVDKFRIKDNIVYPNIIADNVKYSSSTTIGMGCIICLSAVLTVNISLGDFVLVMSNSVIGHDSFLDDFTTIYPSVTISGNVSVGRYSEVGVGAKIIQRKSIGQNSVVGAGAVVIENIPDNCIVAGVPAKPIKIKEIHNVS